jgi:hypothetical protein
MTGHTPGRKTDTPRAARERRRTARAGRYAARSVLWDESSLRRVRACGLRAQGTQHDAALGRQVNRDPMVAIRVTETPDGKRAGFSGVQSCGSTWACPVCSEKIQAARNDEVARALEVAHARGWVAAFVTLTVRHSRRHSLAGVWSAVSAGWRSATSGSRSEWEADRAAYGVKGYIRLTEVTHGRNGWHVHIHALVLLDPAASRVADLNDDGRLHLRDVQALGDSMFRRWSRGVKSVGKGYAPAKRHGVDVRLVTDDGHDLAAYFAKNVYAVKSSASAAADVTSSHTKTARQGNVTPFGILARLVANGEARDLALWHEWEAASKGKRQLLWSNGLRADLGIGVEVDDQTIVDDDALDGVEVARMPPRDYRRLAFAGLLPAVLDAAEAQDGGHRLYSLLSGHGIPWEAPLARAGG